MQDLTTLELSETTMSVELELAQLTALKREVHRFISVEVEPVASSSDVSLDVGVALEVGAVLGCCTGGDKLQLVPGGAPVKLPRDWRRQYDKDVVSMLDGKREMFMGLRLLPTSGSSYDPCAVGILQEKQDVLLRGVAVRRVGLRRRRMELEQQLRTWPLSGVVEEERLEHVRTIDFVARRFR